MEVELKEDNMVEGLESFKVSLELSSPGMSGVMLNNQEKIVTIRDNDSMYFMNCMLYFESLQ